MTLVEFLTARLDEDEAVVRRHTQDVSPGVFPLNDFSGPHEDDEYYALHIGAGRVLREVEAKRAIVAVAVPLSEHTDMGSATDAEGWAILCELASVYADHPDYRQEWRP